MSKIHYVPTISTSLTRHVGEMLIGDTSTIGLIESETLEREADVISQIIKHGTFKAFISADNLGSSLDGLQTRFDKSQIIFILGLLSRLSELNEMSVKLLTTFEDLSSENDAEMFLPDREFPHDSHYFICQNSFNPEFSLAFIRQGNNFSIAICPPIKGRIHANIAFSTIESELETGFNNLNIICTFND